MANKILGYVLIVLGLLIVLGTLYSSYGIFTGGSKLPEIFHIPLQVTPSGGTSDVQKQIEQAMVKQIQGLIPFDAVPKILNLLSWSILAGILILGGGKITDLGIKLVAIKII